MKKDTKQMNIEQESLPVAQTNDSLPVPATNSLPVPATDKPLFSDEKIIDYYEEAISNIRDDRMVADEKFKIMFDKVVNDGDSTSASKEMVVNLLKIKTDSNDRMIKILDLWTRMKLRESNTMSDAQKVASIKNQQNNFNINDSTVKRHSTKKLMEMLDVIEDKNNNE